MLDEAAIVLAASRRARQSLGIREGDRARPGAARRASGARRAVHRRGPAGTARLSLRGRRPRRLRGAALRVHGRRLARAAHAARAAARRCSSSPRLPGENVPELVEQARREVDQIRELIDEVLFLAELESGTRVVSLGAEPVLPVLARGGRRARGAGGAGRRRAARRGRRGRDRRGAARGCFAWSLSNLAENAIRYAGPGPNATLSVAEPDGAVVVRRRRRRRRRRPGRPAAAVRALLPRRPLAGLARHRARARDREARRRLGRRHGRGTWGRAARASRSAARSPAGL